MNQTNYPEGWDIWIYEEKATLIPGVKDFLVSAQKKGVKIFYVTNRRTVYEDATKNNIDVVGVGIGERGTWKEYINHTQISNPEELIYSIVNITKDILIKNMKERSGAT